MRSGRGVGKGRGVYFVVWVGGRRCIKGGCFRDNLVFRLINDLFSKEYLIIDIVWNGWDMELIKSRLILSWFYYGFKIFCIFSYYFYLYFLLRGFFLTFCFWNVLGIFFLI